MWLFFLPEILSLLFGPMIPYDKIKNIDNTMLTN